MGDDHSSDSPTPESRAPWERPLADPSYREAQSGRPRRLLPRQPPPERTAPPERRAQVERTEPSRHDSGRIGRRAAGGPTEALSVADLVKKVSGEEPSEPDDPDKTEIIPPIDERQPPQFVDRVSDGLPDLFPAWAEPEFE